MLIFIPIGSQPRNCNTSALNSSRRYPTPMVRDDLSRKGIDFSPLHCRSSENLRRMRHSTRRFPCSLFDVISNISPRSSTLSVSTSVDSIDDEKPRIATSSARFDVGLSLFRTSRSPGCLDCHRLMSLAEI